MTPNDYILLIAPIAVQLRIEGSVIFPSLRIAQAGLETGWKLNAWNNLVGFKVGNRGTNAYWKGAYVNKGTWEVYDGVRTDIVAAFRAYDTIEDGFRDQDLLFELPRYAAVRAALTPEDQAIALVQGGYATDPVYATKLISIINNYSLKKYDKQAEEDAKMLEELKCKVDELTIEYENVQKRVAALEARQSMPAVPDWAEEAVKAAVQAGIINNPVGGSWDFYRLITVLHRKKLI